MTRTAAGARRLPPLRVLLGYLALSLAVVALYRQVLWFPYLAMGDAPHIVRDPLVNAPNLWGPAYLLTPQYDVWAPWTLFIGKVAFRISDGRAWSYHLFALGLHAANTCLLAALARKLGSRAASAWLCALVFAVHPLVVQPVAWADCLEILLCTALTLASTLSYLHLRANGSAWRTAFVISLATLAMLSHPSGALLGTAWLLGCGAVRAQATTGDAPRLPSRAAKTAACLVVLLGALTMLVTRLSHPATVTFADAHADAPWSAFSVSFEQLRAVVWPSRLLALYPAPSGSPDPSALAGLLLVVMLASLALARRSPLPVRLPLALLLAHTLASLLLAPVAHVMRDAHVYLPLAMLLLAATHALDAALARTPRSVQHLAVAAALALCVPLAMTSRSLLPRWRGGDALWEPVLRAHPRFGAAYDAHADELAFRHELKRAAHVLARGYRVAPAPEKLLRIGTWLSAAGALDDAECVLLEAAHHEASALQAETTYAALLAYYREHEPRDAAVASAVVSRIEALRQRGELHWPHVLREGLQARLRAFAAVTPAARPWPARACSWLLDAR